MENSNNKKTMTLLNVSNISIHFGGLKAVDRVSFHVDENEIVSIIGPNGAGKTTIFNIITGLYSADEGEAKFLGQNILKVKTPEDIVKMGISRTFQTIRLFKNMRVIENVLVGTHITTDYGLLDTFFRTKKYYSQEKNDAERAIEILDSVGLKEKMHILAKNLPYGEQRKLEVARAIATGAKLLLLDEPAAGMNAGETKELLKFLRHLNDDGFTILLIEHDMKVVMNISDRIYVLDYGRKIADGIPREIANNPDVIRAYLGEQQ